LDVNVEEDSSENFYSFLSAKHALCFSEKNLDSTIRLLMFSATVFAKNWKGSMERDITKVIWEIKVYGLDVNEKNDLSAEILLYEMVEYNPHVIMNILSEHE
jgi:hypothetical protein